MNSDGTYSLADLQYSAYSRCRCGAGLAYVVRGNGTADPHGSWYCGDWLLGRAPIEDGCASHELSRLADDRAASTKHDAFPFVFFEIKSEDQPSAQGATTRPKS